MDGHSYHDISLSGKGAHYPDPHSEFFASEHDYVLMTLDRTARKLVVEIRSLAGAVLERKAFQQKE